MDARELAEKFRAKIADALIEKDRQTAIAAQQTSIRKDDIGQCKRAMEENVIPFLAELTSHFTEQEFSFAPQIDVRDHKPVGVSFRIGGGLATSISTAFGNIVVTSSGDSGASQGVPYVYAPDREPYISSSGDLTREKIGRLVEMVIDNTRL